MLTTTFSFVIFCGLLGILLRRNYLNTAVSLLQTIIGINALLSSVINQDTKNIFEMYLIIVTIFIFTIFMYSIAVLLIKRRSTLQINELAELRG